MKFKNNKKDLPPQNVVGQDTQKLVGHGTSAGQMSDNVSQSSRLHNDPSGPSHKEVRTLQKRYQDTSGLVQQASDIANLGGTINANNDMVIDLIK